MGTFLVGTLAGPALVHQAGLREDLLAWLHKAQAAGLSREDITALIDTTLRTTLDAPPAEDAS